MTSAPTPLRAKPLPEKLPPFDAAAEEAVLGSVLVDDTLCDRIADMLAPEDFYRDQHAWIFAACLAVWRRGEVVNQVTVAHELGRTGKLDDCGGLAFLARLTGELVTPVGAEHYAAIVRRDATYRRLISVGSDIVRMAYDGGPDLDAVLERCERSLRSLSASRTAAAQTSTAGELARAFWDEPVVRAALTVQSGLRDFDKLVMGFAPGDFAVIASQTGIGKSIFLLNAARNTAVLQGARCVVFTLEINKRSWWRRLLAAESGIEARRLDQATMTEHESARAMTATATLAPLAIDVHDRPGIKLDAVRRVLRERQHQRDGIDLVLVDYLQLVGPSGNYRGNRTAEVTEISRGLKEIAGEFDVPVLAAAQLSRKVDERPTAEPKLSDLRESGSIEQDADVVALLWRPDEQPVWNIKVAKNRNGPTGICAAGVAYATGRCWDLAERDEEGP